MGTGNAITAVNVKNAKLKHDVGVNSSRSKDGNLLKTHRTRLICSGMHSFPRFEQSNTQLSKGHSMTAVYDGII